MSNKSSTGRKNQEIMDDGIFQDFGNDMDVIMENMYENLTKTNNMFSSLGVDMESGVNSLIRPDEDYLDKNRDFQKDFFKSWSRKTKKVNILIY